MRSYSYRDIVMVLFASMFIASLASGQTPRPAPAPPAEPSAPIVAGWQDGFFIQSANGDFRLQLGVLIHADGRFALDDEAATFVDTFSIRRLRSPLRGRVSRRFEFYLNPDFAGGALVVQDAYVDTIFSPAFRVRVGKSKTPFGLERMQSASSVLFFERALPSTLVPNRDVGVQVLGDVASGLVSYHVGVMNGVVDGGSADLDTNDGKDIAGRLVVRPFTTNTASPLRGLGVAVSGTRGSQAGAGALPTLRTPSLQQQYFAYSGAAADGVRTRYPPQVFYFYKGFGGWFEHVHTNTPIRRGAVREEIAHDAWQVAGSYVLTGEAALDGTLRPRNNFDFGNGHWGAIQVAARYHTLKIDDLAFTRDFVADGSTREVDAWTVGLNWYLTQNFRYVFNFERSEFDNNAAGARKPENGFVFRTQINF